ncbi:hypothetical protein BTJ40_10295 [Microbulbifer sp. A4B17]|uniref:BlaI/MecI/CopY family transcriptional regulator n=1 Tax=Microbulbifer sp. A4B17 TaxID=359370 RepID=UPI000D52AA62|nr:hypothetical protein BTJ40_10295 [Microbulbifer sp. A4B17]
MPTTINIVISASEQIILEVLWKDRPLAVEQIIERVQETSDWHPNTIKTMLSMAGNQEDA